MGKRRQPLTAPPTQPGGLALDDTFVRGLGLIQLVYGGLNHDFAVDRPLQSRGSLPVTRSGTLEMTSTDVGAYRICSDSEKTQEFTTAVLVRLIGGTSDYCPLVGLMYNAAGNEPYGDQIDTVGGRPRFAYNKSGTARSTPLADTSLSCTEYTWIFCRLTEGRQQMIINGALSKEMYDTGGIIYSPTSSIGIGSINADGRNPGIEIKVALRCDHWISDAEMYAIMADPGRLAANPRRRKSARVAQSVVDTSIAGAATATASAVGALSTTIRLSAGAAAVAAATGSLSTAVRMSGAAIATASGAGALSTSIRLAGVASAQAGATGSITTTVRLAGAGVATASGSAALSTAIPLSGAAQAAATASGTLAGGAAQLSGAVVASASTTGALASSIALAGLATAQASATGALGAAGAALSGSVAATASATGALLTTIRMAGLAAASASASGSLGGSAAQLSGAAVAGASASGSLSTSVQLAGSTNAIATGAGVLWASIRLAGSAGAAASASGVLWIGQRIDYARAPDGTGYAPRRIETQTRPGSAATARPAATQRNNR